MSGDSLPHPPDAFTVVSWNILLDYTRSKAGVTTPESIGLREYLASAENADSKAATFLQYIDFVTCGRGRIAPQPDRLLSIIDTLQGLDLPTIDVAMLQEVQESKTLHSGEEIARALGYSAGFWFEHNSTRRKGERIGTFGSRVENAEMFDLGHDKVGVLTMIGQTAVVGIHFRKEYIGPMRADQAEAVVERVEGIEHVVLVGDPNALFFQKARCVLHKAGLTSAFHHAGRINPKTHPTPEYRKIFYAPIHRPFLPGGTASDIIYIRGMNVHGEPLRFKGDSDHYGLAATMSPRVE